MEVKEAVRVAKEYVNDIFSEETISDLGLEEVDFDHASHEWRITLGFSRPWSGKQVAQGGGGFTLIPPPRLAGRVYKVVRIDDERGRVASLKNRSGA